MSDARPVADLAQRQRALDPTRSFIVQAPAGSGKTELLIQRYLALLARVERPEEVAAITFTRKASAEMRKRVGEALHAARAMPRPEMEHHAKTWDLASAVTARSDALGWALEDNTSRLRIQTIDTFCASLTRQMPVLAKFGAQPETIEDATALYAESARATLAMVEDDEAIANDAARVLAHLDNDVQKALALLADLLRHRDHWVRYLAEADNRAALESVLGGICRAGIERAQALFPVGFADGLPAAGEVAAWRALVASYLTKEDTWRKRPPAPPELAACEGLLQALVAIRALPDPRYSDEQWAVLGAITRLAKVAIAQLKVVFAAHGQADFIEIAQGALAALETPEGPTDLLLSLDYRIRHILVDEFQDTSFTQFELLQKLTSGWEPGDGRTLFVVGDPMQSIYRFREAEVGLFLQARRWGIGTVLLEALTLSTNFRSQAGIVDWVNTTFEAVMPTAEDIGAGAVPYSPSHAVHDALDSAVHVHPFFNDDKAGEARRVVDLARRARDEPGLDPSRPPTCAILVRGRAHFAHIAPRLAAAGLKFRAIEIERLGRRPVVQDLLALTRALSHLADRTAWLAVLRAPWCGLTLDDLHRLAQVESIRHVERTLWESLHDEEIVATLSPDGRRRLEGVRGVLEAAIAQRGRGTLREAVEGAWLALLGPACVEAATDLEDAEIYLDHLSDAERAGALADLGEFESNLATLYALPDLEADERLQVMTIHKSKGLEFDTVILPQLGVGTPADPKKLFLWMERTSDELMEKPAFFLAPINPTGGEDDSIYEYIRALDKEKDAFQEGRLLYVASTRPKMAHHLLGDARRDDHADPPPAATPKKGSMLQRLWGALEGDFTTAARTDPVDAPMPEPVRERLARLPSPFDAGPGPEAIGWSSAIEARELREPIEFSWAGETARHVGSVVHRWMQRIAGDGLESWSTDRVRAASARVRDELAVSGVGDAEMEGAAALVVRALSRALDDPRGRWILQSRAEAASEIRFTVNHVTGRRTLAIDRTFVDGDGRRWIVDFKTSGHQGADLEAFLDRERERYREQLDAYAIALGDPHAMRGLYFPLVGGWREWG